MYILSDYKNLLKLCKFCLSRIAALQDVRYWKINPNTSYDIAHAHITVSVEQYIVQP